MPQVCHDNDAVWGLAQNCVESFSLTCENYDVLQRVVRRQPSFRPNSFRLEEVALAAHVRLVLVVRRSLVGLHAAAMPLVR